MNYTPDEVATIIKRMDLTEHELKFLVGWFINRDPDQVVKAIDKINQHRSKSAEL